jgi:hypothetical protein
MLQLAKKYVGLTKIANQIFNVINISILCMIGDNHRVTDCGG